MKKLHIIILLYILITTCVKAQNSNIESKTIQPTIMVIPYANNDQDLLQSLERDINTRVAISKVKEGFDNRKFSTIDLKAKLKQLENDKTMESTNQSSLKQQVIEISGADLYVEVETKINYSNSGNSVTVIINGFDAYSGISLSNKVGNSAKFYTDNFEKLTINAVNSVIEDFLNTMQIKFEDIVKNGRITSLNITFGNESKYTMDSEIDKDHKLLSENIEEWMEKNAFKSYFHIQGQTSTKMIIDEFRLPLRDINNNNYRISKFVSEFRAFLRAKGLDTTRDIQGSKIFITIN